MKQSTNKSKLQLSKETVQRLNAKKLAMIGGGNYPTIINTITVVSQTVPDNLPDTTPNPAKEYCNQITAQQI